MWLKNLAFKYLKEKRTTSYLIFNTFVGTEGTKQGLEFLYYTLDIYVKDVPFFREVSYFPVFRILRVNK